jgi:hypothetical protein
LEKTLFSDGLKRSSSGGSNRLSEESITFQMDKKTQIEVLHRRVGVGGGGVKCNSPITLEFLTLLYKTKRTTKKY